MTTSNRLVFCSRQHAFVSIDVMIAILSRVNMEIHAKNCWCKSCWRRSFTPMLSRNNNALRAFALFLETKERKVSFKSSLVLVVSHFEFLFHLDFRPTERYLDSSSVTQFFLRYNTSKDQTSCNTLLLTIKNRKKKSTAYGSTETSGEGFMSTRSLV